MRSPTWYSCTHVLSVALFATLCSGEFSDDFLVQSLDSNQCALDLCIIIDGSGSVEFKSRGGSQLGCQAAGGSYDAVLDKCINYGREVKFVHDMMRMFEDDGVMGSDGVQIAGAVYSDENHDLFELGDFTSANKLHDHGNFTFPRGKTYTKNAIQHCYNHLSNKAGYSHARKDSTKMIILMTDGEPKCAWDASTCPYPYSSQDPSELIKQISEEGVHVAVVSIGGDWMSPDTLQNMKAWATQGELYYGIEGFSNDPVLRPLKRQACAISQGVALPPQSISNDDTVPVEYWDDVVKAKDLETKKAEEAAKEAQHAKAAEAAAETSQRKAEKAAQDAVEATAKAEQAKADERVAKDAAKKEADAQRQAAKAEKAKQDAAEAKIKAEQAKAAEQAAKDAAKKQADTQAQAEKEKKAAQDADTAHDEAKTALDAVNEEAAKVAAEHGNHANSSIGGESMKPNPIFVESPTPCGDLAQADLDEVISSVHFWAEEVSVLDISMCHEIGRVIVNNAEQELKSAKSNLTDALAKVQQVGSLKVDFGSYNLAQLKEKDCSTMWRNQAYVTAKQASAESTTALEQAAGGVEFLQDELAKAEAAAFKEANACRCKVEVEYHTEWKLAIEKTKTHAVAWKRGKEMQCLLAGISVGECDTSGMPSISNVAVPDFKCDSA